MVEHPTTAHLRDLRPDPRNARQHTSRGVGMVEHSIQRDGFGRSILVANDGTVIAGNATIEAAAAAGIENVIVVESDGRSVIAVKRTDIDPDSEAFRMLALADNRASDLSMFDTDALRDLAEDTDLSQFWFSEELAFLLGEGGHDDDDDTLAPLDTGGRVVTCPECGHEFKS